MLGLIASIKNIKQNIQENIVQCWFHWFQKPALYLFAPHQLSLICRQTSNTDYVNPML